MSKPPGHVRVYICDYIEKEKTLASRHLVSSVGICRDTGLLIEEASLPEHVRRILRLRGEAEVFDYKLANNILGSKLGTNQYLKLRRTK